MDSVVLLKHLMMDGGDGVLDRAPGNSRVRILLSSPGSADFVE